METAKDITEDQSHFWLLPVQFIKDAPQLMYAHASGHTDTYTHNNTLGI